MTLKNSRSGVRNDYKKVIKKSVKKNNMECSFFLCSGEYIRFSLIQIRENNFDFFSSD